MPSVQTVSLSKDEKEALTTMLRKGRRTPRQIKRALILILADMYKDLTETGIAHQLVCSRHTVRRVRYRFFSGGLEMALGENTRPGQPRKLRANGQRFLLSLVSGERPAGYVSWTLPLLQKRLFQQMSTRVSRETIRRFLTSFERKEMSNQ